MNNQDRTISEGEIDMEYRISVQSIGHGNEVEWVEDLTAPTRKGARAKATKWLQSEWLDEEEQLRFSVNDYESSEVWQLV